VPEIVKNLTGFARARIRQLAQKLAKKLAKICAI
jgi:hypothetical protein